MKKGKPVSIIPGAESVFHINDHAPGVLLLHGFTGSPKELALQGEAIIRNGYSVAIPRYPGHGTSLDDMLTTSIHDWYRTARETYIELARCAPRVIVVGLSMGGLFALNLACEFETSQTILISTPAKITDRRIYLAPLISPFTPLWCEEDQKKGINDPDMRAGHICYPEARPIRQAWQLFRFMKKTMKILPHVTGSVLIMQSERDEHIHPDSADLLEAGLTAATVERFSVKMSNHTITADFDRDKVTKKILDFINIVPDNTY